MKKLTLLLGFLLVASVSQAQVSPVAKMTLGELKVGLFKLRSEYQIRIAPRYTDSKGPTEVEVFWIKNPSRLVIDIPGFHYKTAKAVEVDTTEIARIRSGVHKDKVRLVVDIKSGREPGFEQRVDGDGEGVIVNASFNSGKDLVDINNESFRPTKEKRKAKTIEFQPGKKKQKSPQVELPSPNTRLTPTKKKTSMSSLKDKFKKKIKEPKLRSKETITRDNKIEKALRPDSRKKSRPLVESSSKKIVTPPVQPSTRKAKQPIRPASAFTLKGIDFQEVREDKTTAVVLNVSAAVQYEITQAQDDLFEVKLNNTKVQGMDISIPHFTPEELYQGFEVVVARQQGANVVVRIYTDSTTRPLPFEKSGKLWIKPVPRSTGPVKQ